MTYNQMLYGKGFLHFTKTERRRRVTPVTDWFFVVCLEDTEAGFRHLFCKLVILVLGVSLADTNGKLEASIDQRELFFF